MQRRSGHRWKLVAAATVVIAGLITAPASPAVAGPPIDTTWSDSFSRANGVLGQNWVEARGTWRINSGQARPTTLVANGGPTDQMAIQNGVTLGNKYIVTADVTVPTGDRTWNGIATNVSTQANGTQNAYVFRIGRGANDTGGRWQVMQLTGSDGSTARQIASGLAKFEKGDTVTMSLSSAGTTGRLSASLAINGQVFLQQAAYPGFAAPQLYGGKAALYSLDGTGVYDNFSIETSSAAAVAPAPPAALQCTPAAGSSYTLPNQTPVFVSETVVDRALASHPVGQALLTNGSDQYVAYYNVHHELVVAKRTLPSTTWSRKVLDTEIGYDSHNYVTMQLDPNGNLHVSGNMHGVPLNYWKTSTPGNVQSLARVASLVDPAQEQKVTYPTFIKDKNGGLIFTFRSGGSGDGVNYYYRYNHATNAWSELIDGPLFDGEGQRSAYTGGQPRLGPDGMYHVTWVWRDTPDAATNSRLSYMRSPDLVNWETLAGTPITLPVKYNQPGVVVDDVPIYEGLLNGLAVQGFAGNVPIISYHKYDAAGNSQLYVAKAAGSTWTKTQVTQWSGRWDFGGGGSLQNDITLGRPSSLPDGRIALPFGCLGSQRTIVLNANLTPHAEVPTPPSHPSQVTTVRNTNPAWDLITQIAGDGGGGNYVMRWESAKSNLDKPRPDSEYPKENGTPLSIITLG
ncbi:BNR repeat-containing protein [Microbacterium radiodurans]|uniref:BNR repeat-containing protein n=1 Tax=Microbacterium radiodurans TaxID=661398 RepID=UPI00168BB128|nr:BNR repeat-containing protein [Microbacterium radiodurans]